MKIIGVISGKGGVGKTTTVANVGTAIAAEFRRRVLLVDGDPNNPDLPLHLGVYSVDTSLKDVLDMKVSIKDAIIELPSGVDILPAPFKTDEIIDIRGLKSALRGLNEYDVILVDSPPGLGSEIEPIFDVCDEVIIVTNLEVPAVTQALKAIVNSTKARVPITGMVLNMVRGKKFELSPMEVELVFDAPVIGVIPEDWNVKGSVASGEPLILNRPNAPSSVGFKELGGYLLGLEYSRTTSERMRAWFGNLVGRLKKSEMPKPHLAPPPQPREEEAVEMEALEVESAPEVVEPEPEFEMLEEKPEIEEELPPEEETVIPEEEIAVPEEEVVIPEDEPVEVKEEEIVEAEPEFKVEEEPPKWENYQEISVESKSYMAGDEEHSSGKMLEDARRRAIAATMNKLEESYEKGFIKESIYIALKKKYIEELGELEAS